MRGYGASLIARMRQRIRLAALVSDSFLAALIPILRYASPLLLVATCCLTPTHSSVRLPALPCRPCANTRFAIRSPQVRDSSIPLIQALSSGAAPRHAVPRLSAAPNGLGTATATLRAFTSVPQFTQGHGESTAQSLMRSTC